MAIAIREFAIQDEHLDRPQITALLPQLSEYCREKLQAKSVLALDFAKVAVISADGAQELAQMVVDFRNSRIGEIRLANGPFFLSLRGLHLNNTRDPIEAAIRGLKTRVIVLAPQQGVPPHEVEPLDHHTLGPSGSIARCARVFAALWEESDALTTQALASKLPELSSSQINDHTSQLFNLGLIARVKRRTYEHFR